MRGGSPAAETDHVWAAAAHISPLCKVAGPPMINSTGELNGGSVRGYLGIFLCCWPPSAVPVMAQWTVSRAVYLYIAALEVNVLNCRRPGAAVAPAESLAHVTCPV